MHRLMLLVPLSLLLVGCQAKPAARAAAAAPRVIEALSDQTIVYTCPSCGMDYDAPGKCTMCDVDLVKTQVSYVCPADNQPVARAGQCPRCDVNARIVKTTLAEGAPPGAPGTSSTAPGGS